MKDCDGWTRLWRIGVGLLVEREPEARFSNEPEKGVKGWSVRLLIWYVLLLLRSRCSIGEMEPWLRGWS